MPEYPYKCKKCNHEFVIVHGMLEVVETYCPNCYSKELARKFTKTEPIFNGLGWGKEKRA
jgi:putative FmdB family regulatory protein